MSGPRPLEQAETGLTTADRGQPSGEAGRTPPLTGIWSFDTLLAVVGFNLAVKVCVEIVMTLATYFIVNRLKRAEHEDYYDDDTNFTPFSLRV